MKTDWSSFVSELIAVILGIVITFTVQGRIDKAHDRREVRSALELVRVELASNLDDISELTEYLKQEQISARYLEDHRDSLDACPVETVKYHQGIVNADVSVSFSHDALELLKLSSLLQKVGNNPLSMKIISAYNCCELMETNISRHISGRDAQEGDPSSWLIAHNPMYYTDSNEIKVAIEAIDTFLRKR